jgi:hypothetical protein
MIDNNILFVSNIYVSLLQHYANMKALLKGKQDPWPHDRNRF